MTALGRWSPGDVVVRRERLGMTPPTLVPPSEPWAGRAWLAVPVHVVEDHDDALVTYIAPGAQFGFPSGDWPTPDGRHPWWARTGWSTQTG